MRPAAIPSFMAISGVIGKLLASPRTPSVPNNLRVISAGIPLAERPLLKGHYSKIRAAHTRPQASHWVTPYFRLEPAKPLTRPSAPPDRGCGYSQLPEKRRRVPLPATRPQPRRADDR